jgi:protease-4
MREFLKYTLASTLGVILALGLFFLLSIGILSALISGAVEKKTIDVKPASVLSISLSDPILDRGAESPFARFKFAGSEVSSSMGLNQIIESIERAKDDPNITGIFLDLGSPQGGIATLEQIQNAIMDFKKSKKFVYAYSEFYTQSSYLLASVADSIFLYPEGDMMFNGFSLTNTFYKGVLDKLGIEMKLIRVGKYKSAGEPYIRKDMSAENKYQLNSYLQSAYFHYLGCISEARNIAKDSLFAIANTLQIKRAKDAVRTGLVDRVCYRDEVLSSIMKKAGASAPNKINFITLPTYFSQLPKEEKGSRDKKVALIYAIGEIISGEGDDETIGSDRIANAIRDARLDDKVKAIVLRVNSPGGSALASDVIWREMELARKVKPVVVSMGNVAASGGYYISSSSDRIFAEPNTITGSIGVFGLIPNVKDFMNNKLGLTTDGVKTGKFSDLGDITRPMTAEEENIIQEGVNQVYRTFLKRVSDGRKMSIPSVDSLAQGRIYTGTQAKKLGLVDELGGLDAAIKYAIKKAGLSNDVRIKELPEQKDPFKELISKISGEQMAKVAMEREMGEFYTNYVRIKRILKQDKIQMRLYDDFFVK